MVTCQEIEANPQQYANQEITLAGTVQTGQVLPQGVWLVLNDGTASLWVWSSEQLEGSYYISGTVYDNYFVLSGASPMEGTPEPAAEAVPQEQAYEPQQMQAPAAVAAYGMSQGQAYERAQAQAAELAQEDAGTPLLKPVVVSASALAYGFGLYSLTLSFPPSAKTGVFYALPVVALLLEFAPWFALKKLGTAGKGILPRFDDMWKLYPPLIISAFLALYLSPEVVAETASPEFSASIRNVFFISLAPLLLSLVLQFVNTGKYEKDAKNRLAISLISVAIIGIPLLVLYPLLTGTLG